MKLLILILSVSCFLQACTKSSLNTKAAPQSTTDAIQNIITGNWDWVQSEGGLWYRVETPANKGYELQLQFNDDGTVNYLKNGAVQFTGPYALNTVIDAASGDTSYTISQNYFGFYSGTEVEVLRVAPGTITFDEPGADRFSHTYKRSANQSK